MNQLKSLLLRTRDWIDDPFGRKELLGKHEEVIGRIRETTAAVSVISHERFPISKMVGHEQHAQVRHIKQRRGAHNV